MSASKTLIKSWWQKAKSSAWRFLAIFKKRLPDQEEIDKKLVYSLSPRKIPSREQLRHLNKFLNPREFLAVKVSFLIIIVSVVYLGVSFVKSSLQYSPLAGGTYIEALVGYPKNITPWHALSRDVDADLSRLLYSRLFYYDANGRLQADLVTDLKISPDHKEYQFQITDQARWHNGEPLTAADVVFTIETIQNPSFYSPLRSALSLAKVEQIDNFSFKLRLEEPYAPFLELLTFGISSRELWKNVSPEAAILSDLNLKVIGSGPYRFKSLVRSSAGDLREYHLEANKDYYGPVPYISELQFKFFSDYDEALGALNSRQVDGLSFLPFDKRSALTMKSSLNIYELPQARLVSLFFNQNKNQALADRETRSSLAQALDKDELVERIFNGAYQRADGPIFSASWAYNDNVPRHNYNPEAATEKLSAGPFRAVLTVVDYGQNTAVAQAVKDYWEAAGAEISIRSVSGEQAAEIIKNRDFEILLYGQSVGGDPDVYAFWHSSQSGANGLNLANYNNSEVDKLLLEARASTIEDERREKYYKFQEIIATDLPAIFLYSPSYTYVQNNKVQGFSSRPLFSPSDRFSDVSAWYIKTKKKLSF